MSAALGQHTRIDLAAIVYFGHVTVFQAAFALVLSVAALQDDVENLDYFLSSMQVGS